MVGLPQFKLWQRCSKAITAAHLLLMTPTLPWIIARVLGSAPAPGGREGCRPIHAKLLLGLAEAREARFYDETDMLTVDPEAQIKQKFCFILGQSSLQLKSRWQRQAPLGPGPSLNWAWVSPCTVGSHQTGRSRPTRNLFKKIINIISIRF